MAQQFVGPGEVNELRGRADNVKTHADNVRKRIEHLVKNAGQTRGEEFDIYITNQLKLIEGQGQEIIDKIDRVAGTHADDARGAMPPGSEEREGSESMSVDQAQSLREVLYGLYEAVDNLRREWRWRSSAIPPEGESGVPGGDMEGRGKPQHMSRGYYYQKAINRKIQYR
jgi:hypothetical protein